MELVKPIDDVQQQRVISETIARIQMAGDLFHRTFDPVPVSFDLKGRAAGMYRVRNGQRNIRYNPWLFARYFNDNLVNTVPHEVAHYIIDMVYGRVQRTGTHIVSNRRWASRMALFRQQHADIPGGSHPVRPHGKEWRALMIAFKADPSRTCHYDLEGIPVRTQKQHDYFCPCSRHRLSTRRHNQILRKTARYFCRQCRGELTPQVAPG